MILHVRAIAFSHGTAFLFPPAFALLFVFAQPTRTSHMYMMRHPSYKGTVRSGKDAC